MKILGISCFYHDSSACLIIDDKVVAAAAEERFSRIKHDNQFPHQAISFCLDQASCAINEIDAIAFYEKPLIKFERILFQHLEHFPKGIKAFTDSMGSWVNQKLNIKKIVKDDLNYFGPVYFVPHHLSHAASSYYLSGFNSATIVTIDGVGEWATTTIGSGVDATITQTKEVHFPHSLGLLYSTITSFLGFKVNNDEYKIMGLSAYGNSDKYLKHFKNLIKINKDGSFQLNMQYFDFDWAQHMPNKRMEKLFGTPQRKQNDEIKQIHADIAAALQKKIETIVFKLLKQAYKEFPNKNLCLSGGVALNSLMNGKILSNTPFKKLFIPPDPGDGGASMGAALEVAMRLSPDDSIQKKQKLSSSFTPYLGPSFEWYEVETELKKHTAKLSFELLPKEKLLKKASEVLAKDTVLAWFQGAMEWGPRALGNRSFIASASKAKMKDVINEQVKKREMFRPFAPVILEDQVSDYFITDNPLPESAKYMVVVYPFIDDKKEKVPAVVHKDGTGRLQTISEQDNPLYYQLIKQYQKKSGVPILINTSFNVQEPIVCTPQNAIECFLGTDVEYMVIDSYFVRKKND